MGTYYRVTVASMPSTVSEDELKTTIATRLERVNSLLSTYIPDSEISRFNRSHDIGWFPVSVETATVVTEALKIFKLSDGAFDITVGPLVDLWGFGSSKKKKEIPSRMSIESALKLTGSEHLHVRLTPPALKKDISELQIDLSAIAKGYAVDSIVEALTALGITDCLVDIGGEISAVGQKSDSSPWKIAIESPIANEQGIQKVMTLSDMAIATSGDYRNYFEVDGKRYSHEIDPRTGQSIQHSLVSVSVLSKSCMRADALATALIVLGPKKGQQLENSENLDAYYIIKKGIIFHELETYGFSQLSSLK